MTHRHKLLRTGMVVAMVHVGGVVVMVLLTALNGCRRSKSVVKHIPVDFVMTVPAEPMEQVRSPVPHQVSKPPERTPVPRKVERSKTLVRRPVPVNRQPRKITADEVEAMLRPERNTTAAKSVRRDDDAVCRAIVRQTFHDVWAQPSYADVGDATAMIVVRLRDTGSVTGWTLDDRSGNLILDESVRKAADSVKSIPGLTKPFLATHKTVMVSFKVLR